MKTTELQLKSGKSKTEEPQTKAKANKRLKFVLILFMLSWISFLPSCAVAFRTPEPTIIGEKHSHRLFHRNHYRRSHIEYHNENDHHR